MTAIVALDQLIGRLASDLALTDAELAGALGATPRSLDRWRRGVAFPQHDSRRRLETVAALRDRVYETFDDPADVAAWLHANSNYLGGIKPIEALQVGRIDSVAAALEALDSGIFL